MELNQLQQEAVNCPDKNIIVTAPPGSGKTRVMIEAIKKYNKENPFGRVVAITFTKKAASELSLKTAGIGLVEASTIHSWSLKELNKLGRKHGLVISLLQEQKIKELLFSLSKQAGYYSLNQFLLYSFVTGNYNIDVPGGIKGKFTRVNGMYIKYKRDNRLYDFMDLPLYLLDILTEYGERIKDIDALFVDEFQDVDEIQAKIFTLVDTKKKFYIGDVDQAIYIFRGASGSNLKNLNDFTSLKLDTNYRSYQPIIDFAVQIGEKYPHLTKITKLSPNSWIRCARGKGEGEVFSVNEEGSRDLVTNENVDPEKVIYYMMAKRPYILCRSNKQVKAIKDMGYENVSTVHQAKGLEYPNVIVTDFAFKGEEEEINIAYVACTRAMNSLLVVDHEILLQKLNQILFDDPDLIRGSILF